MNKFRNNPRLVVSGPGTGKTTEIINLIENFLSDPHYLGKGFIACTFTRNSSTELEMRLKQKINNQYFVNRPILIGTIHSICLEILKMHPSGKFSETEIISEDELPSYINSKLARLGFNREDYKGSGKLWELCDDIVQIYSLITDQRIDYTKIDYTNHPYLEEIVANYPLYLKLLAKDKKIDFALVQLELLNLLKSDPLFAETISEKYSHVFVDEYQDTNNLQNELLIELVKPSAFLTVVGDDDQSIYAFRGAVVENLLSFEKNISLYNQNIEKYYLSENYRSTHEIVNFTNEYISTSGIKRFDKKIQSAREEIGIPPIIQEFEDPIQEAKWIAKKIFELKSTGKIASYSDVAVLYRSAKFQSEALQNVFFDQGIPYQVNGVGNFFDLFYIKEFLIVLDFILNRNEDSVDELAINLTEMSPETYSVYFGNSYVANLIDIKDRFSDFGSCIALVYDLFIATDYLSRYAHFGENLGVLTELILNYDENVKAFDPFWMRSYLNYLRKEKKIDQYTSDIPDQVRIQTIHRAKGLEFHTVFLPFQIESLFKPNAIDAFRSLANLVNDYESDEKRLFYVGITRAKNLLCISYPKRSIAKKKQYEPSLGFIIARNLLIETDEDFDLNGVPISAVNPDKLIANKPSNFSYSALRTFEICPKMYMYLHAWKLQTVRTGGMQFGSNVHRIIELVNIHLAEHGDIDADSLSMLFNDQWKDNWYQDKLKNEKFRKTALEQIKTYVENREKIFALGTISSVEEKFDITINNQMITGRFDLTLSTEKINTIVDFKTGDAKDYSDQLAFYGICFQEKYQQNPLQLYVYYLKDGSLQEVDPGKMNGYLDVINEVCEKIKLKKFRANPGKHCSDCAFNKVCDEAI